MRYHTIQVPHEKNIAAVWLNRPAVHVAFNELMIAELTQSFMEWGGDDRMRVIELAEHAYFCLSEVKIGLIPATISPYVIKAMGLNATRRYFLTAKTCAALEALRIGLLHQGMQSCVQIMALEGMAHLRFEPDPMAAALHARAQAVLVASPQAVKETKRLVRDVSDLPLTDTLIADTVLRMADVRASEEGNEGVQAFLEKRPPKWLH